MSAQSSKRSRSDGDRLRRWAPLAALTLGLWFAGLLFFGLGSVLIGGGRSAPWTTSWLLAVIGSGILLSLLLYGLMELLARRGGAARWPATILAIVAVAAVQAAFDHLVWAMAEVRHGQAATPFRFGLTFNLMIYLSLFGLYGAGVWLLGLAARARSQEQNMALARAAAERAHLEALRYRTGPAFLFAVLDAAARMVASERHADAEAVVARLSSFLRGAIEAGPQRLTSLENELAVIDDYVAMLSAAEPAEVVIELDCPVALREVRVPTFLFLPILEAIASASAESPLRLSLTARASRGDLILRLDAAGQGALRAKMEAELLPLQRAQLRDQFGEKARLEALDGPHFAIRIILPGRV